MERQCNSCCQIEQLVLRAYVNRFAFPPAKPEHRQGCYRQTQGRDADWSCAMKGIAGENCRCADSQLSSEKDCIGSGRALAGRGSEDHVSCSLGNWTSVHPLKPWHEGAMITRNRRRLIERLLVAVMFFNRNSRREVKIDRV